MKKQITSYLLAAMVIVPMTIYALASWHCQTKSRLPVMLGEGHRVGQFLLRSQDNKPVSHVDWDNKIVVANFFFSHCPVVCPKMISHLKTVQGHYQDDPGLLFTSFTVD